MITIVKDGQEIDPQSLSKDEFLAIVENNPFGDLLLTLLALSSQGLKEAVEEKEELLSFSDALEAVKEGERIARKGWNGKDMYLYYVPANNYKALTESAIQEFGESVPYSAYLAMKTAQGNVVPWLASQTDLLEEDWLIL